MTFINRERELRQLDDLCAQDRAHLVVLYGRRRIGKTALLNHWFGLHPDIPAVYWVAYKSSSDLLLEKFSQALQPAIPGVRGDFRFKDWDSALDQLFSLAEGPRLRLAIDEFPYLVECVPEFPSLLQARWDRQAAGSRLFLLLSGSHFHMMRREFTSGKGPLYGRSTADLLLEEIPLSGMHAFLPRYSPAQVVETYSIIGGVPKYLDMWDDRKPVLANVAGTLLSPVTIFRQEALYLIYDELPEPRTYLAIMESLGAGMKTPSAIARDTGVLVNHVGKYLNTLRELGFVRRIISLDAVDPDHSRMSRYELRDPYLRFFFSFIQPHLDLLEQERTERLLDLIRQGFPAHVGKTGYEELARRAIARLGDSNGLPFVPGSVGRLWRRNAEFDVAAIDRSSKSLLLAECKWQDAKMPEAELEHLQARAEAETCLQEYHRHYALFSRGGFTAGLLRRAAKEQVLLFSGPELQLLVQRS